MQAAEEGSLIVADAFRALRHMEITENECKQILTTFERARASRWRRIFA